MNLTRRIAYSPIGIDVGARAIKAVQLVHARDGSSMHAAASIPRLKRNEDQGPAEMLRVLGVLRRQGFVGSRAVLCVPAGKTLSGVIELPARTPGQPALPAAALDAIARQELARACKREPHAIELNWWELPSPAGGGAGGGQARGPRVHVAPL